MAIFDELFGSAPPKREVEERTADYQRRVAEDWAVQNQKRANREKEVRDLADAADPERRKKFMAADRAAHRAWHFSCKVSGGFLVMRWTDDQKSHAHALNMSSVSDIRMSPGKPVRKGDIVRYNEHDWEFLSEGAYWSEFAACYGRPFWTDYIHEQRWAAAAQFATVEFVGPGFIIDRIPHRRAEEAYLAILSAIEAAA